MLCLLLDNGGLYICFVLFDDVKVGIYLVIFFSECVSLDTLCADTAIKFYSPTLGLRAKPFKQNSPKFETKIWLKNI